MMGRIGLRGITAAAAAAVVGGTLWIGGGTPAQAVVISNSNASAALRITGARFVDPFDPATTVFTVPSAPFNGPFGDSFIPEGDFNQPLMDASKFEGTLGVATATASGFGRVRAGGVIQTQDSAGGALGDGIGFLNPGAQFGFDSGAGPGLQDGVRASASASSTAAGSFGQSTASFAGNAVVETFADFLDFSVDPFGAFADVEIDFELDVDYLLEASTDGASILSEANANAVINLSCGACEIILDAILDPDLAAVTALIGLDAIQISDAVINDGTTLVSGVVPFTVLFGASILGPSELFNLAVAANTGAKRIAEPATWTLFAVGMFGLVTLVRRRRAL